MAGKLDFYDASLVDGYTLRLVWYDWKRNYYFKLNNLDYFDMLILKVNFKK
jgi:hypothetical protein